MTAPQPNASRRRGPMPQVAFDGSVYSLRSRTLLVPDLKQWDRFAALQWLIANTYPRGYSRPNSLAGVGGAISIAGRQ
jgi:hypothetical protein